MAPEEYCKHVFEMLGDKVSNFEECWNDPNSPYLKCAHRWLKGNVLRFMYSCIPYDKVSIYVSCIGWSYIIIRYDQPDITECDPVFHRPGIVSHLYALFYQFPNLTHEEIHDKLFLSMWIVAGYITVDEPLFHTRTCQLIEEGLRCNCGMTWKTVLAQLTKELCQLHNQRISPLSVVWDSPSDDMLQWLPKEMVEDVVWLMGGATMDTMLVTE